MQINDETVRAHAAARRLLDLYDAYRAASRAHAIVLRRLEERVRAGEDVPAEKRQRDLMVLQRRIALAAETDSVFAVRRDQLRRRLLDLQGVEEVT
jgi:hypothetical protein